MSVTLKNGTACFTFGAAAVSGIIRAASMVLRYSRALTMRVHSALSESVAVG